MEQLNCTCITGENGTTEENLVMLGTGGIENVCDEVMGTKDEAARKISRKSHAEFRVRKGDMHPIMFLNVVYEFC